LTKAKKPIGVVLATLTLAVAFGIATVRAEFVQSGNLLVSFDAGLKPSKLPRSKLVPVRVGFKGTFENLDASDTPALNTMVVRLSRGGRIDARGLPRCAEHRLQGLSSKEALLVCGAAQIGSGTANSAFRFPDGSRVRSAAKMLLFNAPHGILMHVYTTDPLKGTFLVPMSIHKGSGAFGTVLRARFPKIAAGYGYLTGFEMVIDRSFTYRGETRSYVLASCPAPKGFNKITFELARVTFAFRNGVKVRNAALRTCTPRD
jgi:hypothetical protein